MAGLELRVAAVSVLQQMMADTATITGMLGCGLLVLIENPDHAQMMWDDPQRNPGAIWKMLRWDGPTAAFSPMCATICLGGVPTPGVFAS